MDSKLAPFYPSPVLASGYCLCARPCDCVSTPNLSDNSSRVQARVGKFGPEVQNTLVKIYIVLGMINPDL